MDEDGETFADALTDLKKMIAGWADKHSNVNEVVGYAERVTEEIDELIEG